MSRNTGDHQASQITIVGLGPGGAELLTRQAWDVLSTASEVLLRTSRHPAAGALPDGIRSISLDPIYETAVDFAEVYRTIARTVVSHAQQGPTVYAVPGHPFMGEATVPAIQELATAAGIPVRIVGGMSFVEPVMSALGLDGLDGLQLFDAIELAESVALPLNPDLPTLLGQVYSQLIAGSLKLSLMTQYPDEHQVALVHAADTADQLVEWVPLYAVDRSPHIDHLTSLYVPPTSQASSLTTLAETVSILRGPGGCPWDQQQTSQSLRQGLLEEMAEVLEAIDIGSAALLQEELGDLLFHIVMQAQVASEDGEFGLAQVIAGIDAKLKRRHPHVWGDWEVADSAEVVRNWEMLKQDEKGSKPPSLLNNLPPALPALATSQKIQRKVSQVGFDWPDLTGVFDKLDEELQELVGAETPEEQQAELGDTLFVIAHLANWLDLDAEAALREANLRFSRRFRWLEQLAAQRGIDLAEASLETLNQMWDEAKSSIALHPDDEEGLT